MTGKLKDSAAQHLRTASNKLSRKHYAAALRYADMAINADPTSSHAHYLKASTLDGLGHAYETVMLELDIAILLDPKNKMLHLTKLILLAEHYEVDKMEKELKICMRLDPNAAILHQIKGMLSLCHDDKEKALKEFDRAIKLDPNMLNAYISKCKVLLRLGEDRKCAEILKEVGERFKIDAVEVHKPLLNAIASGESEREFLKRLELLMRKAQFN